MPQSSTLSSEPAKEVTASTIDRQLCLLANSQSCFASDMAPVEVSACTKAKILASGLSIKACSTFCGSTGLPQSSLMMTASPPTRMTFSFIRVPNTPLMHTMTLSPGSTRFAKQASMPADPGAEIGIVNSFSVMNAYFNICLVSSIISINAGSRCPIVCLAIAFKIRL